MDRVYFAKEDHAVHAVAANGSVYLQKWTQNALTILFYWNRLT